MRQAHTHGELLIKARAGDQEAWNELVEDFGPMVWSVARSYRLDEATAKDVAQSVWVKLVENCDRITDPERLPGWLATTCRREAMAHLKRSKRAVPTEFEYDIKDDSPSIEEEMVDAEDREQVKAAFSLLSEEDQQLLHLLVIDPPMPYAEIAQLTGRPVGSLGPTRARVLDRLRKALEVVSKEAVAV